MRPSGICPLFFMSIETSPFPEASKKTGDPKLSEIARVLQYRYRKRLGFKLYPRKIVVKPPFWHQPPLSSSDHGFSRHPIKCYGCRPDLSSIGKKNSTSREDRFWHPMSHSIFLFPHPTAPMSIVPPDGHTPLRTASPETTFDTPDTPFTVVSIFCVSWLLTLAPYTCTVPLAGTSTTMMLMLTPIFKRA